MSKFPSLNILLADDDSDDRFFFRKALEDIAFPFTLVTVADGEQLLTYLKLNSMPDILFLDLNMPRMNGSECLTRIKTNKKIRNFPVIIYSTALDDTIADLLYQKGAHYYLRKGDYLDLLNALRLIFNQINDQQFIKPSRDKFLLNGFNRSDKYIHSK
ncbi:MAG: response regulator [Bacteroidia bacterium]